MAFGLRRPHGDGVADGSGDGGLVDGQWMSNEDGVSRTT